MNKWPATIGDYNICVEDRQEQEERCSYHVERGWLFQNSYNFDNLKRCLGEKRMFNLVCCIFGLVVELRSIIL